MRRRHDILALLAAIAVFVPAHLHAQEPSFDPRTDRLRGLSEKELARVEPCLARGPVALVEFANTKADELPGVNVAIEVHAAAAEIASILKRPEHYPRFMRTLDAVELVARHGEAVVYDWSWKMALFELSGRNAMHFYDPPKGHERRGYRITVDSQHGDLGQGRMLIRIRPRSAQRSVVVLSMRLDLRRANYIARQLARASRSVNRSANMSLLFAMGLSLKREAERVAKRSVPKLPPRPFGLPEVDMRAVIPLLTRGDLVMLDVDGEHLQQLAIFGIITRKHPLVREVMLDADSFGSALMPGSQARVISREGDATTFEWDLDLPLVGLEGTMRLEDHAPRVTIEATEGAMKGGRWHFETKALGKRATLIKGWAQFDLGRTNWLLQKLVGADPNLGIGMSAASEVMLVRALRSRTRKREKELAAARGEGR